MTGQGLARRYALLWAMGALLGSSGSIRALAQSGQRITIPTNPMILTRVLGRGLRDGQVVTVTRQWQIQFEQRERGVAVTGEQVAVSVDAPEVLAELSQIERNRSTKDMFPILLSSDGTIMVVGTRGDNETLKTAIKSAEALIAALGVDDKGGEGSDAFFAELQRSSSSLLDQMPGDLFYPSTKPLRFTRTIELAEGAIGEFELNWSASANPDTALMEQARREVITRIGKDERKSYETWRLAPV